MRNQNIHCIKRHDSDKSWCGVDHGMLEPYFKSIDQAALNKGAGFNYVCPECRKVIIDRLVRV